MDFGFLGGLTGLLEPLKTIYNHLEKNREKGEVADRLRRGTTSIKKFESSLNAIEKVGPSTLSFMDRQSYPLDKAHFEELLKKLTEFFNEFNNFLESLNDFGRDCYEISSLTGFMERVKSVNSDVYDIIDHFAKHYDPKKKELDLTGLPTLLKVVGGKGAWKEDKNAEKKVKEAIERAKAMSKKIREGGTRKYAGLDKRLATECLRSLERLLNNAKKFRSTKETNMELRSNAPAWFGEIADLFDEMERLLKKTQEKKFYSPKKPLPPPTKWRPGSDNKPR